MNAPEEAPVVIAGAGPGGLTAAYLLTKRGAHPVVLEVDDVVGGISRTVVRDGAAALFLGFVIVGPSLYIPIGDVQFARAARCRCP